MNKFEYKRGRFTVVINKETSQVSETKNAYTPSLTEIRTEDLKGKVIVFTGRGPYSRGELFRMARAKGCIINTNTITKHTYFLVVGLKPGSKLKRAEALGIKIIMMDEFLRLISE